ncbi:hypothetical protein SeLEV6574_g08151, partial [Synchytrium endobioticum]
MLIKLFENDIEEARKDLDFYRNKVIDRNDKAASDDRDKRMDDTKQLYNTKTKELRDLLGSAKTRFEAAKKADPSLGSASTATAPPNTTIDMDISTPVKFDGTSTDYKRFRHEATNAVTCKPKSLNTDERRIRYIGALFTGVALEWYMLWQARRTTLLQEVNPSPKELERRAKEYDMLIQDMDTQFKDPLEIQTYRSLLNKVNQG